MATSPRSRVSVTRPSNSKFPPGLVLPPLQASSHSRRLPGERGKVFGGRLESAHARFGNEFWIGAVEAAKDFAAIADEEQTLFDFFAFTFQGAAFFEFIGPRGFQAAVIPGEFDGRHVAASSESVADDGREWIRFVVTIAGTGIDAGGRFEFESTKNCVEAVRAHVAKSAATEVAPAAPDKRQIHVIERASGRGAEPEVPIEAIRDGIGFLGTLNALRPERTTGPIHNFAHRADRAAPNPFAEKASRFGGLVGNGDLRSEASFAGNFSKAASFIDGVS